MLHVPALRGKDLLDSVYDELGIQSPESYYYDHEVGATQMCRALARAWLQLERHVRSEDLYPWRRTASLTVQSGTPNYVALPSGFVSAVHAYTGTTPVRLHYDDDTVLYSRVHGGDPCLHVPVTRQGDTWLIHSASVAAGSTIVVTYNRKPPPVAGVAAMAYTADGTYDVAATVSDGATKTVAYADDELVGAFFVSVGQSWYGWAGDSSPTTIYVDKASGSSPTVPASRVESAWVAAPQVDGPAVNAIVAQACLYVKGEDLGNWKETVAMIRSGRVRRGQVASRLPRGSFSGR